MALEVNCPDCDVTHLKDKCKLLTFSEIIRTAWSEFGNQFYHSEYERRFRKWLKGCNYGQGGFADDSEMARRLKAIGFSVRVDPEP